MVEKIDRPEAPPAYAVREPTESKRDKPKEERRQEDLPTFQRQGADPYRGKFQSEAPSKTFKVPLEEIGRLNFLRAVPRHGVPMADADLVWKDGTKIPGVSFLIKNWQDFMKLKNLKSGEPIPADFWNYGGNFLEITMRSTNVSGPWRLKEIENEASPLPPPSAKQRDWKKVMWGVAVGVAILIVIFLLNL